jgi:hypothetical protein
MATPSRAQAAQYSVNRPGWEAVRQSLYDFQQYPAAGVTQLSFFNLPVGQGTSWAGGGTKNLSDTNLSVSGMLPANQEYLIQSIELVFLPGTPTVAAVMPSAFGAQAVAAQVNDTYIFRRAGNLTMVIGSKPYLQEGPLARFPSKTHFEVNAAIADVTTAGATMQSRIAEAHMAGRPYLLSPVEILLPQNQNFNITLNWPEGVQAISNPARVGVILDGILYRKSQ